MATDLSDLKIQLNVETSKIDRNDKLWSPETKTMFLNQGLFQVQKDCGFDLRFNHATPEVIAAVAGTQEYALPAQFIQMRVVTFDGQTLNKREYEDLIADQIQFVRGTPYEYYIYGDNIGLNAIPDNAGSLNLYYRKRLLNMSDSQNSQLPSDFDLAIVKYAAYLLWSTPRGNRQTAQEKVTDYEQAMNTIRSTYLYNDTADLTFRNSRRTKRNNTSQRALP